MQESNFLIYHISSQSIILLREISQLPRLIFLQPPCKRSPVMLSSKYDITLLLRLISLQPSFFTCTKIRPPCCKSPPFLIYCNFITHILLRYIYIYISIISLQTLFRFQVIYRKILYFGIPIKN